MRVEARTPEVARRYIDVLSDGLGRERVKVIVEAFKPFAPTGFRSATPAELLPQIAAMHGHDIYLFDGPHCVSAPLIEALVQEGVGRE